MKEIYIDDIYVKDIDNGKVPLVFVHAFPLNSRMWDNQLSEFAERYRVIAYDVRGLGKSKSSNNQFMMEHYSNDFIKIADHLGIENLNAVGLSMGGYILQRALLKRMDLFNTITLADTRLGRDTNDGLIARANAIEKILNGRRNDFADDFIPKLLSDENMKNDLIVNNIIEMIAESTDEGIAGAALALATRTDNKDMFNEINTPCLVIAGESDKLTPPEESEIIKKAFKNSELKIIEKSGHMSNIENPGLFNSTLNNFLKKYNE